MANYRFGLKTLLLIVFSISLGLWLCIAFSRNVIGGWQLISAVRTSDVDWLKNLIAYGANVNYRDSYKSTPLMYAASMGQSNAVAMLLGAGADPNARDMWHSTALMYASGRGDLTTAKILLDAGADVNERTRLDRTALIFAAGAGKLELVQFLLSAGADPRIVDLNGDTAAELAKKKGFADVANSLRPGNN
jgi:uncharacterized protein